jgi:hypothetical protein
MSVLNTRPLDEQIASIDHEAERERFCRVEEAARAALSMTFTHVKWRTESSQSERFLTYAPEIRTHLQYALAVLDRLDEERERWDAADARHELWKQGRAQK